MPWHAPSIRWLDTDRLEKTLDGFSRAGLTGRLEPEGAATALWVGRSTTLVGLPGGFHRSPHAVTSWHRGPRRGRIASDAACGPLGSKGRLAQRVRVLRACALGQDFGHAR